MKYNPTKHYRRSIRLKEFDYRSVGAYFITIVTANRDLLFGEVVDSTMVLSDAGRLVKTRWIKQTVYDPSIVLDVYVIMPNHIHGIIFILEPPDNTNEGYMPPEHGTLPGSVGAMIQSFKSVTSRMLNDHKCQPGSIIWQRNYHEHIIRDESELESLRDYVLNNPLQWSLDEENPAYKPEP